jgi:two-component system alkaline phosphatase synthesis response regulator PhoP
MSENNAPICVVEDNTPIRKLFCTLLKKAGFETVDFADGASAFEWIRENKPLLIILDILLPDTNGTDLLGKIKEIPDRENVPVIAVTGFANVNDKSKFMEMGFDSYIAKPVNTATFVDQVKQVL